MAQADVDVKIKVDSSDATNEVDKLNKSLDNTKKTTKEAEKNAKQAGGAFGTIGSAIKSLGIISIIAKAFDFFREILFKNKEVADAFSTGINFLTGVFSDLVKFIVDNTGVVVDFVKNVFENPKQFVLDLADAIKENLLERIKSLVDAFGFLGEIIKNVFTGEFDAAKESAKNFGKELLDVVTGVDDSFDKSAKAVTELTDAAGKYFKNKLEQAKALTKASNDAALAEARVLNVIKQTEIEAEKLRQRRDDETLSLEERIKANDELSKVLQKGQQQELALIGIRAQKIQAEIALNGENRELQAQLIQLEGERADIVEKFTGRASEQLAQRNALLREQIDIEKAVIENQNKLTIDARKANAELIRDEIERLEVKKQILKEESELELKRLQDNIDRANQGTTARAQAEIAYAQKKSEIDNQLLAAEDQIAVARFNRQFAAIEQQAANQQLSFDLRREAIDQEQELIDQSFENKLISEKDYTDKVNKLAQDRIAIDQAEKDAKIATAQSVANAIGQLSGLFKQGTAAAKIAAISEIAINTGIGLVQGLDIAQKSAKATGPGAAFAFPIFYATQVAAVLGAAAKARQILRSDTGAGSGAGSAIPNTSINVARTSAAPIAIPRPEAAVTALDRQTINQLGSNTTRAYVVESDITNSQERITRINRAARLG